MLIQIVLIDAFDPLDALAPYEAFLAAGFDARLVAADGPREVTSGVGGLALPTTRLDPRAPGAVLVPGAAADDVERVVPLLADAAAALAGPLGRALAAPGVDVLTVCGGSLVLAMAGLIGGRRAVTHRQGLDALAAQGVEVVRARVVDDGDLVSAGGVTSGVDLALHYVQRTAGAGAALALEDLLEHERRGVVWTAA
ncbi:DJ-1/PfpI family protein [Actinokineospora bangkokensis]|uniref:DJ-1/PfpI domain-containing protein n=1 Tax=Actinokineospora bangkokensis TaxID=1193682 RepID=A0A1Q9LJB0_9PSEU|nr:DJ-1/PfpI family protein [Actinokineospora bangkokensis]OLR92131.1 hypothetical protein BJP25_22580 [Actinokineospora bangkokensis]